MISETCPFCKKEVIDTSFATYSGFIAIYNHAPIVPGHSLIIPLNHVTDIMELSDTEFIDFFQFGKRVMQFLNAYFKTNEFDMSLQQGRNAGQSVDHVHLHLIPRKPFDLKPGEEWYHKMMEKEYKSLDSDKIISKSDLLSISQKLRKSWEKYNAEVS
ncbi:MAG TPA: HIT domain-containing protein [Lentimicrobium sp.]|nr:HIT domain-containing protein [Lentimicrobium sp.]